MDYRLCWGQIAVLQTTAVGDLPPMGKMGEQQNVVHPTTPNYQPVLQHPRPPSSLLRRYPKRPASNDPHDHSSARGRVKCVRK